MHPFNPGPGISDYLLNYGIAGAALVVLVAVLCRWPTRSPVLDSMLLSGLAFCVTRLMSHLAIAEPRFSAVWMLLVWPLSVISGLLIDVRNARSPASTPATPDSGRTSYSMRRTVLTMAAMTMFMVGSFCLTGISHPREASNFTRCKRNLKQIGLALHNYHDAYAHFPSRNIAEPPRSWRVDLLPYLDNAPLAETYDQTQPWNAAANQEVAMFIVSEYKCPSVPREINAGGYPVTAYVIPYGPQGIWHNGNAPTLDDITDGSSHTIAVVEACGLQIPWAAPLDASLEELPVGVNLPGSALERSDGILSSYHYYGAHALLADGAVRYLSDEMDPQILNTLLTAQGGEAVDDF